MVRDRESDGRWFRAKEEGRDGMKQEQEGMEDGSDVGEQERMEEIVKNLNRFYSNRFLR
jgi:hypothetical protein